MKKTLTIGLLLTVFISLSFAGLESRDEALNLLKTDILSGDWDRRVILQSKNAVNPGDAVSDWHQAVMTAPAKGWFFFLDDHPQANWEHPCRYIFIGTDGSIQIAESTSPPANYERLDYVDTEMYRQMMSVKNRYPTRTKFGGGSDFVVGEKWALLVNGGYSQWNNHIRYWNDLSNIYCTLVDIYGYEDDHIWVLCSDGLNPAVDQSNNTNSPPDLDGDHDDDIMGPGTLIYVEAFLDSMAQLVDEDDLFLYFNTDHGSSNSGWSVYINLWNQEQLQDWHFAQMMNQFPQSQTVFCFEQCYSGGFEDNLMRDYTPLRQFNSACTAFQSSWAMAGLQYDEFVFHWTAALRGEDAFGNPVNADSDGDGFVDMEEAFIYAEIHDVQSEQPQYSAAPNPFGIYETMDGLIEVANLRWREALIDDDNLGSSSGNGNGIINPGETIELGFFIRNAGTIDLIGLTGVLSSANPYVEIIEEYCSFPDMGLLGGGTSEEDPFLVGIAPNCPTGYDLVFGLTITDENDSTWNFDITLNCAADDIDGLEAEMAANSSALKLTASPNPFNNQAAISYCLPEAGDFSLKVYDSLGREIATLAEGYSPAGNHTAHFDAADLSSGIYFYRLKHQGGTATVKSLLIK